MMEHTHHPALHAVISRFCAGWNEPDEARRRELLESVWAVDGIYVDPMIRLVGLPALVGHIGAVLAQNPGTRLVMTSDVDAHHGLLMFSWCRIQMEGTSMPACLNVAELSGSGALQRVIGFFGPLPPAVRSVMRLDS